ncbi:MAG: spheroidene monooxygenase [Flavobacteriia bacterium]|nr:spheroidene monooxygenase [Flavobacteriia bacterium]
MEDVRGLVFYKLLGSGAGNGFSIWPDFSTFVFLAVWEDESARIAFQNEHASYIEMRSRSEDVSGATLSARRGHGTWNGKAPFLPSEEESHSKPLAVLTRASISRKKALKFWRKVPTVSRRITQQPGLLWAKGVGELPLVEQATISFWKDAEVLQKFAYGHGGRHQPMVKMTREVGWYDEEMFVRFDVLKWEGSFQQFD